MLFAALSGEHFDGHEYIQQAKELGAVAVLVCQKVETDLPVLQVKDVLAALGYPGWILAQPMPCKGCGDHRK